MEPTYLVSLFGLKDQVVVITGGVGKLGTQFAEAFSKAGAKVAILDLVDTPNLALAELSKQSPFLFLKVDLTNESDVEKAFGVIQKEWGAPDILVNNAGWKASPNDPQGAGKPFEEYSMDLWDEVFRVNIKSAAICSKIAGRMMNEKGKGVIINVASHYALVSPDQRIYKYKEEDGKEIFIKDASYGASKAALLALTRDLSTHWAPKIRVVAVAFGGVLNPKSDSRFIKAYSDRVPLGRMARPDEYNGLMLFLASDAASYITGTTIVADGGWSAW